MDHTLRKITKKYYTYECGDDCCCYEDGYEWSVDGEFVHRSSCEDSGWLAVLKHLGLNVELSGVDEKDEEIWSL